MLLLLNGRHEKCHMPSERKLNEQFIHHIIKYEYCRRLADSGSCCVTLPVEESTALDQLCVVGTGWNPFGLSVFAGKRAEPDSERRDPAGNKSADRQTGNT